MHFRMGTLVTVLESVPIGLKGPQKCFSDEFPTLYIETFAGTFYQLGICNTFLKDPKPRQKRQF